MTNKQNFIFILSIDQLDYTKGTVDILDIAGLIVKYQLYITDETTFLNI